MTSQRYKLGLGNGAYGPGDIGVIIVVDEGNVAGPTLADWQAEYMLAKCLTPTSYYGYEVRYLALCPRYETDSLNSIRSTGGVVAVGRILRDFVADKPEQVADKPEQFEANDVEYWAMGVLTALDD
jgi:hypothetical protein